MYIIYICIVYIIYYIYIYILCILYICIVYIIYIFQCRYFLLLKDFIFYFFICVWNNIEDGKLSKVKRQTWSSSAVDLFFEGLYQVNSLYYIYIHTHVHTLHIYAYICMYICIYTYTNFLLKKQKRYLLDLNGNNYQYRPQLFSGPLPLEL